MESVVEPGNVMTRCDGSPRVENVLWVRGDTETLLPGTAQLHQLPPTPSAALPGARLTSVGIMEWLSRVRSFTKRIFLGFFTKGLSSTVAMPMNLGRQGAGVRS